MFHYHQGWKKGESEPESMSMDVKVQLYPLMIALAAVLGVLAKELLQAARGDERRSARGLHDDVARDADARALAAVGMHVVLQPAGEEDEATGARANGEGRVIEAR
jgi:hypothetical protein